MEAKKPRTSMVKKLIKDQRGSTLPLIVILLFVLCGASVFAVDMSYAFLARSQLLTIAEAAAMAAASAMPNNEWARSVALTYSSNNQAGAAFNQSVTDSEIEFGYWDRDTRIFTVGGGVQNAVRVNASLTAAKGNAGVSLFGSVFGRDSYDVSASAVGGRVWPAEGDCVIALHPTAPGALNIIDDGTINLLNCGIYVNSSNHSALQLDNGASLQTNEHICVRGGTSIAGFASISPYPEDDCRPRPDPFATLAEPTFDDSCDYTDTRYEARTITIYPGVYCGGIYLENFSDVTFSPGIYIIKDGQLEVDTGSSVTGDEVSFFFTGTGATAYFDRESTIDLSAPTSGPMAGVIMFQDRDFSGTHVFDSENVVQLSGALYFPNGDLYIDSSTAISSFARCTQLIASTIEFDSSGGLQIDADLDLCPGGLPGESFGGRPVVSLLQ